MGLGFIRVSERRGHGVGESLRDSHGNSMLSYPRTD
jgi:hypothetical protein